jgi:molybdopterin synthase catalytic subunit
MVCKPQETHCGEDLKRMANPVCEVLLTEAILTAPENNGDPAAGAVVDFWGVVRGVEDGRQIEGIGYEAHREMAEHQLKRIAGKAMEKFPVKLLMIHHRIGFIGVGEPSLFVRVTSQHRAAAFRASQWIVDELKKKVPIWKRPGFKIRDDKRSRASASAESTADEPSSATAATAATAK